MTSFSLKRTLDDAIDSLLSLHGSPAAAFSAIERLLATFALDPSHPLLDAFLSYQDSLTRNLTAVLLEWLGRILARQQVGGVIAGDLWEDLARVLRLFQGLLLLHRPSQRFFARRSSLEYLLAVLDMTRPSHPFSPSLSSPKPFPSPVIFPSSPFASPNLSEDGKSAPASPSSTAATVLALAALDALLCALVDRPKNMRVFEEIGGLATIVKILKDKSVAQVVRIKVIELLYYYLMPEQAASTTSPTSLDSSFSSASSASTLDSHFLSPDLPNLLARAADFVPQTPVKPRPHSYAPPTPSQTSSRTTNSASSRESSPTRTPRRGHTRSQNLVTPSSTPASSASHRLSSSLQPPHPLQRPLSPSSSAASSGPLSRSRPSSRPAYSSRTPTISESDTDTDAAHSSAGEDNRKEQRTPRASRLSGLLSPAATALGASSSSSHLLPPSSTARIGHRRTQSASTASTPSSSLERQPRTSLDRTGLPLPSPIPPPSPRRSIGGEADATPRPARARMSKSSSDAEEMPPPPLPLHSSSSSSRPPSSSRPVSHSRSRSLASVPSSPLPPPPPSPRRSVPSSTPVLPPPSPRRDEKREKPPRVEGKGHTRTEQEKKDLLRRVMPNVDALEERFRAMGLGVV
ncbi:hypothetical protein JCM8547_002116 [Rhodosporidiobolus lusitaniae]